jgi:hypothetical protein
MKLTRIIIGLVPCLSLALTGQAQMVTTLDWPFSVAGNPSTTNPPPALNPSGGTATATFLGPNNTYFFGVGPEGLYGPPTGLWDIQNGQLQLAMNRYATSLVDFTLEITQFVDNGAFFPGTVSFSILDTPTSFRTIVYPQTGGMVGSWVADTFQWSQINVGGSPILLTISPGAGGNGHLFFDEVELTINGNLTDVPEPGCSQLVAAGLLAFGARSWLRRKRG